MFIGWTFIEYVGFFIVGYKVWNFLWNVFTDAIENTPKKIAAREASSRAYMERVYPGHYWYQGWEEDYPDPYL